MRLGAALISLALVAVACGTAAEDVGTDLSIVPTTMAPTTVVTTLPSSDSTASMNLGTSPPVFPTAPGGAWPSLGAFDAQTMDRFFPSDQPTVAVWVLPPEHPTIGRIHLRFDGPDGEAADDRWDVPPPGEGLHLLTRMSVPANTYEVTVTLTELSTDTSDGQPIGEPVSCSATVDAPTRSAVGLRLVLALSFDTGGEAEACGSLPFSQWLDVEGRPVSPDQLIDLAGPAHCDWQDAHFLSLSTTEFSQYIRDPGGAIEGDNFLAPDGSKLSFAELDGLPADAVFSGFRSNGRELWFAPGGEYAYLRTLDGTERWPRASSPVLCA